MSEEYKGVKFETIKTGMFSPVNARLHTLKHWCRIFHEQNLAPPYENGSYGNLSFRVSPGKSEFIITGTCIGLKEKLGDDKFVLITGCDMGFETIYASGTRQPSSESMLHYSVYETRPHVMAVFHGHSPDILAAATELNLPVTEKEEPYGTLQLAKQVMARAKDHDFFIIRNHGFISLAISMDEAGDQVMNILRKVRSRQ